MESTFSGLQNTYVHLEIPKFKVKSEFELKDILKAMGMVAAFDENLADFTGLCKNRKYQTICKGPFTNDVIRNKFLSDL